MKKIFCPKCDEAIVLSDARLRELRERGEERQSIVCPSCTHQLRIRLRSKAETSEESKKSEANWGHIIVLENVFGYKQYFPLRKGLNHIGRRNKDTQTDIPIITGDPSMDRHHCIIKVSLTKQGQPVWALMDHDSHVGTFVGGNILGPKEYYNLSNGDVFTLGATSVIFSTEPMPQDDQVEGESVH